MMELGEPASANANLHGAVVTSTFRKRFISVTSAMYDRVPLSGSSRLKEQRDRWEETLMSHRSSPTQAPVTRWHQARLGLAWLLAASLLFAACAGEGTPVASPVTEEQVTEMAENALRAYNSGDYSAWSRDWSDTMKGAIGEEAFLGFRASAQDLLGNYVAIKSATGAQGQDRGTYRWTFDVEFHKAHAVVWFGFKEGSPLIEGVNFEEPAA